MVLDLGMPGMGGLGCLKALKAAAPELKVVIASGYAPDGPVRKALVEGAQGYVAKPYRQAVLLKEIRRVLDRWG